MDLCTDSLKPNINSLITNKLDDKGDFSVILHKQKRHEILILIARTRNSKNLKKFLVVLILFCSCLIILYANVDVILKNSMFLYFKVTPHDVNGSNISKTSIVDRGMLSEFTIMQSLRVGPVNVSRTMQFISPYNIFVVYTKESYQLRLKFDLFIHSLLKHSSVDIYIHVITDDNSKFSAENIIQSQVIRFGRPLLHKFYDINQCLRLMPDILQTMKPYFSSTSTYSDTLFYISLGLYRIADAEMDRAVLLDCDIVFRSDIRLLFAEFERFSKDHLFGLAPELTPVYRHILHRYRKNFPDTDFGSPYHPSGSTQPLTKDSRKKLYGYPGLNSGVVMLFLSRVRSSHTFKTQLKKSEVRKLTAKYVFKGHLGDQDFFTLFGYEFPHLIYRMDCIWNRQLCTWWKDHGYSDIFNAYFHCEGNIQMYHGNCNTRIPE